MPTFKIQKNRNFTVMSNYHLRDKELSLKAKGLLSLMLSLPDDWDYSLRGLVAICKEKKDAVHSTLNELKRNYYLKIELLRDEKGKFDYDYLIYEVPFKTRFKTRNPPNTDFPYTDEPSTDNQPQINTNKSNTDKQIDKFDKTKKGSEEIIHNILTSELIYLNYISKDDPTSFYYDDLFQQYLMEGHNYKELFTAVHYIVSRVAERNFIDDNGDEITNRYGYFKNALESNFNKFECYSEELYSNESLEEIIER